MAKIFKGTFAAAITIGALAISPQAQAAATVCTATQLNNVAGALACVYDAGNINSNNAGDRAAQAALIALLNAPTFAYVDVSSSNNSFNNGWGWDKDTDPLPVGFGVPMFGETIVSMHFGGGKNSPFGKGPGGFTAFYLMNFAAPTNSLTLASTDSLSNAHLFAAAATVPEPSAWALLILGFGVIGGAMRSRGRKVVALQF